MPAQKTINPSACVRSYPVVERHRLVWVWPGEPASPIQRKCPISAERRRHMEREGGTFLAQMRYRLVVDNLMDLTHETYVHAGSSATTRSSIRRSRSPTPIAPRDDAPG